MFKFLKQQVGHDAKATRPLAQHLGQGIAVIFDPMQQRPVTVQYPLGNSNAD